MITVMRTTRSVRRIPVVRRAGGSAAGVLDGITAPNAIFSRNERLLSSYTGSLFRVRRASDNAEADVGYVPATGLVDLTALAAHCSGTNGFEVTYYDQAGNGRNLTQATAANQPKIYDSATGPVLRNGALVAQYDNTNDVSARSTAFGIVGAVGVSLWSVWRRTSATGLPGIHFVGPVTAGRAFGLYASTSVSLANSIYGSTRNFTCSDYTAKPVNCIIQTIGAGAQIGSSRMWQNGVELVEASSVNPTNTTNILDTRALIGPDTGTGLNFINGEDGPHGFWGSVISAGDMVLLNALASARYGAT